MALTQTTGAASAQLRSYFNKRLLEYAVPNFKWAEDALKAPLPQKTGSNSTVTWFRWDAPATGAIEALTTEGTGPTATRTLTLSTVQATLAQYGQIVHVTDLMSAQELFSSVDQGIKVLGQDAALHLDIATRAAVVASGAAANNVLMGSLAAVSSVSAAAQTGAYLTTLNLLSAATKLKIANAPKINGYYHACVCPQSAHDLMAATGAAHDWVEINKYVNNMPLLDGEIGKCYGVRVKESTIPLFNSTTAAIYTASTAGTLVVNAVYGRDSYGISDLVGQSPYAPQVIITSGPDKSDPLNQVTKVGWKTHFAAKQLNGAFISLLIGTSSQDS